MGVTERSDETVEMLTDNVCNILYQKAGVEIEQRDIVAIHRIPGKAGMPKPVLIKVKNSQEKKARL